MAPNRVLEQQPPASSSSEDEGSETTGSESDSETDDPKTTTTPAAAATPPATKKPAAAADSKKPETHQPSDDDDDESGSESDSESDKPIAKNIKPIASKPMEELPKSSATKKPRSKPSKPASPTPAKSAAGAKRVAESEPKESKRAKKKVSDLEDEENGSKKTNSNTDDQKKQLFQRLWSEDDEIVILKGIMDYVAKKGADPVNDMNAFHDFIKKNLHIDVTKTQLQDKVRRLKKKFENNASKEKPGKDRTFSKAHEQKAFDLSKKIWAPDGKLLGVESSKVNGSSRKSSSQRGAVSSPTNGILSPEKAKVEVEHKASSGQLSGTKRNAQFGRTVADPALEEEVLKDGLELIEESKRLELEEKWKKLRVEEVSLYLKRVDLIREQTALVLEAIKSGEN